MSGSSQWGIWHAQMLREVLTCPPFSTKIIPVLVPVENQVLFHSSRATSLCRCIFIVYWLLIRSDSGGVCICTFTTLSVKKKIQNRFVCVNRSKALQGSVLVVPLTNVLIFGLYNISVLSSLRLLLYSIKNVRLLQTCYSGTIFRGAKTIFVVDGSKLSTGLEPALVFWWKRGHGEKVPDVLPTVTLLEFSPQRRVPAPHGDVIPACDRVTFFLLWRRSRILYVDPGPLWSGLRIDLSTQLMFNVCLFDFPTVTEHWG